MIVRQINLAHLIERAGVRRFNLLREAREKLHALLAVFERRVRADSSHHRKMKIALDRTIQDHAVHIHQRHIVRFAHECHRRPLGDFDFNPIRQRATHRRLLDPGKRFNLPAPLVNRNAQDALAAIASRKSRSTLAGVT